MALGRECHVYVHPDGVIVDLLALGPLELWQDGQQHDLGSLKERCVLAVLVHARGSAVGADTLMDRVWDGEPPRTALDTLHSYLSRLRGHLARAAGDRAVLERPSRGTYRLRVAPNDLDLLRFARLRRDAGRAADGGRLDLAIGLLHTAEALWRGDPLAEFDGSWTTAVRHRLFEDHRHVQEERIRLELDDGRHADLLGELRELTARNPLAQPLLCSLMVALYRCGRHDEALAVYRDAHRRLRASLGMEPGAPLRDLHHRILRQDPELLRPHTPHTSAAPATAPPNPPATAAPPLEPVDRGTARDEAADAPGPPDTLPRDIGEFTGRSTELGHMLSAGGGSALAVVAVDGMPGVGKSALVVHAAHRMRDLCPDGRFYLDLHGYGGRPPVAPAEALAALLHAAGVPDPLPDTVDERAARWREWTSRRRVLVVLDNARGMEQVTPLLPGSARCRALVASRHRLPGLGGATPLHLDVLSSAEAATLFLSVSGADAGAGDRAALGHVVEACGRHPLSLHLVAGHFRHRRGWSLDDLAAHLARPTGSPPDAFEETVARSFRLSYTELTPHQAQLLRSLSLHPGPDITVGAAAALTHRPDQVTAQHHLAHVRRDLGALLDRNLLEESVRERYRLHDLTRSFAKSVGGAYPRRAALGRLLDHYLTAAHRADRVLRPHRRTLPLPPRHTCAYAPDFSDADAATVWLSLERGNLLALARAATAAADGHGSGHRLTHALGPSLRLWGMREAATDLYRRAAEAYASRHDRPLLARTLIELADITAQLDPGTAQQHADRAEELFLALGDEAGCADSYLQSGRARLAAGRPAPALHEFDKALALFRAAGNLAGQADCLNVRGLALHYSDRHAEARQAATEVLCLYEELGDAPGRMRAWNNLGELAFLQGLFDEARHCYQRSLALARHHGGPAESAILDTNLGAVHQATGHPDRALARFRKALAAHQASGDTLGEVNVLISMGTSYAAAGRRGEALLHLTRAEEAARAIDNAYERQRALLCMADIHHDSGKRDAARHLYRQALAVAREAGLATGRAEDGLTRTSGLLTDRG
ncbi:AfsR/SARP family transcriptional regulator [Streptomyces sp. WG-D5]